MGYDFEKTHEHILESALKSFSSVGFRASSIRQICRDTGVTNGAFYAHFDSKEDLFAKLVEPTVNEFFSLFSSEKERYMQVHSAEDIIPSLQQSFSSDELMIHFIYEHEAIFRLLLTASGGTPYEDFPAKLIEAEKSGTRSFFEQCLPYIAKPENLSENLGNQCSAMIVHTVFDCLLNGKKESDTIRETQLASEFCLEGFRAVLGL